MKTMDKVLFTRDDYMKLPEGFPAQLIDGELIREPAPTYNHQRTVGKLHLLICRLMRDDRLVVLSPIDVFVDRYNVLQPDVLVLDAPLPRDVPEVGIPAIVVEVLSPSTAFRDRHTKRRIYLDAGVREVWLVDPVKETVEVHTREDSETYALDEPAVSPTVPGLSFRAREVLRD
jgi:Uma2 family endonuclease